jgi:hypothetical protein
MDRHRPVGGSRESDRPAVAQTARYVLATLRT